MIITPAAPTPYLQDNRGYQLEILGNLVCITDGDGENAMDFYLETPEDILWLIDELIKVRDSLGKEEGQK